MAAFTLEWGGRSADISSVEQLDEVVGRLEDEARAGEPFIVELYSEAGDMVSIGLGRPETVISWIACTQDPPYLASRGPWADDGDPVEFMVGGELTEFAKDTLVDVAQGREALRAFFTTGELPRNVSWQEV